MVLDKAINPNHLQTKYLTKFPLFIS